MEYSQVRNMLLCLWGGITLISPAMAFQSSVKKVIDTAVKSLKVVNLPRPYATKSVDHHPRVIGWPADKRPIAPKGFTVTKFADKLDNPRWIYVGPNGDIFVTQSNKGPKSANNIIMFRDNNNDGMPDVKEIFLTGLHQPFGMLILDDHFYVGNTDGIWMYPYTAGETKMDAKGKKILDLPAGGYNSHWTRNIIASRDGKKIFVTVGSASNAGEYGMKQEIRRADILEINPDGTGEHVYASGLRNPQGMGFAPGTNTLWTAVNERDELGDNLPPDFLTSVQEGGFYGWPYSYWGEHYDPRLKHLQKPQGLKKAIVPDVDMGAHTASLGLAFDEKNSWPGVYKGGAFIGQRGSWNRSSLVGYQVAFVPFKNGKPSGPRQPFLTGFIADKSNRKVYGRPVGVSFDHTGALLVADDAGNTIWRVSPAK